MLSSKNCINDEVEVTGFGSLAGSSKPKSISDLEGGGGLAGAVTTTGEGVVLACDVGCLRGAEGEEGEGLTSRPAKSELTMGAVGAGAREGEGVEVIAGDPGITGAAVVGCGAGTSGTIPSKLSTCFAFSRMLGCIDPSKF